jgi:hypothetical protein
LPGGRQAGGAHLAGWSDQHLLGRDPLSNYDQLVKDWQNTAGSKIEQEFNASAAQAHEPSEGAR